jgi:signal transduction histidine kinase
LYALTSRVAERYRPLASERNIRIQLTGASAAVVGDLQLLERVVTNLIDNAVKYSPADGAVSVEVRHDRRSVMLTVRDEGPGIPAEQVPHLFTRFFRGDPARPRAEGSGLGLSIAKAGAHAHGGALEYISDTGGAIFRLVLPTAGTPHS